MAPLYESRLKGKLHVSASRWYVIEEPHSGLWQGARLGRPDAGGNKIGGAAVGNQRALSEHKTLQ
jgi:hypothetical protein